MKVYQESKETIDRIKSLGVNYDYNLLGSVRK